MQMLLSKRFVTKYYGHQLGLDVGISRLREKRKERNLWQRRFWEHLIRDEVDECQSLRLHSLQSRTA